MRTVHIAFQFISFFLLFGFVQFSWAQSPNALLLRTFCSKIDSVLQQELDSINYQYFTQNKKWDSLQPKANSEMKESYELTYSIPMAQMPISSELFKFPLNNSPTPLFLGVLSLALPLGGNSFYFILKKENGVFIQMDAITLYTKNSPFINFSFIDEKSVLTLQHSTHSKITEHPLSSAFIIDQFKFESIE